MISSPAGFKKDAVNPRIFIVGCSRSGTTLLQSLVAAHPKLATFPETYYLVNSIGLNPLKRIVAKFGISTGAENNELHNVVERLGRPDLKELIPSRSLTYRRSMEVYLSILDKIALEDQNHEGWVEKTPKHIFNVDLINRYVPNVKVIHMIRDGREVVASIYKRHREYPEQFEGQDIDYAIDLWNKSIMVTEYYLKYENNYVISYEDVVASPRGTLKTMGDFLELNYADQLLEERNDVIDDSIKNKESWKGNVGDKIRNKNDKFDRIFSKEQQHYILKNLISNDFYSF